MLIAGIGTRIISVPVSKVRSLPLANDPGEDRPESSYLLVVQLRTDTELTGIGWITTRQSRVIQTIIEDLFVPALVGQDPQLNERHFAKARQICPDVTNGGSEAIAYAAIDLAMWDLKTQSTGMPLFQLLGGARESAPAYIAETGRPGLSADQVVENASPLLDQGLKGLWVGVNGRDPIQDANKLQHIRDQLGDHVWLGVCGHHGLDLNTALAFGRFLEEEMDADVYADPCPASDMDANARLAAELELAVATGSTFGFDSFADLVSRSRVNVLRPDIARVGGITPLIKTAALAELHHRVVMPIGNVEVTSQLACGLPAVTAVDFDRRTESFRSEPLQLIDGQVYASKTTSPKMRFF